MLKAFTTGKIILAAGCTVIALLVINCKVRYTRGDSMLTLLTSQQLLEEGTVNLNRYSDGLDLKTITDGKSITMKQLAETILQALPSSKSKITFSQNSDPQEGRKADYSLSNAKALLGYEPLFSTLEGVKKIISLRESEQTRLFT